MVLVCKFKHWLASAVHKVIRAISGIHNHNDTALVTGTGCGVVLELWRRPMVGEGKLRGDGD